MAPNLVQRSLDLFPAGSNGEFNLPHDHAVVLRGGKGYELESSDGRRMIDFSMGWGSVLVGHSDPRIIEPVQERLACGTNFAYVTDASLQLAEELVRLSPAAEQVRFCASGTEATMYCLRLARAATGRQRVLRFEGAYHGAHDVGVTSLFPNQSSDFPHAEPSSHGTTAHEEGRVLVAPFNDIERTAEIIAEYADELAAVIVEPLQRCLPPADGFLQGLREVTEQHGVVLIFDEVVTGFRLAYGGAQERYGVVPDLVAYGKALGGGLPIGAFAGSKEILSLAREDRMGNAPYVWTASTLGGNPISTTAACATLEVLRSEGTYEKLYSLGAYLRTGLRNELDRAGIEGKVLGDGPLAQVAFTTREPIDFRSSQHEHKTLGRKLMLELFRRGVFLNPMGTKLYLSLAHNEAACDELLGHFAEALKQAASEELATA